MEINDSTKCFNMHSNNKKNLYWGEKKNYRKENQNLIHWMLLWAEYWVSTKLFTKQWWRCLCPLGSCQLILAPGPEPNRGPTPPLLQIEESIRAPQCSSASLNLTGGGTTRERGPHLPWPSVLAGTLRALEKSTGFGWWERRDVYVLLCMILTSTPAVLNKPRELATVTMWPWFSSSILGRNALVVWGKDRRDRRAKGKKRGRLVHLCSLSVPKPFDPLASLSSPLLHGDAERGAWMRIHNQRGKKNKKNESVQALEVQDLKV